MGDNRLVEVVETVVDRLDNVSASLSLPTPDRIHVRALRSLLPEIANDLRAALRLAAAAVPPPGARGAKCVAGKTGCPGGSCYVDPGIVGCGVCGGRAAPPPGARGDGDPCKCGAVRLDWFTGTYTTVTPQGSTDHTREACAKFPAPRAAPPGAAPAASTPPDARPDEDWLDPAKTTDAEVDAALRAAGGDPDAIGARGAALAAELLAKRCSACAGTGEVPRPRASWEPPFLGRDNVPCSTCRGTGRAAPPGARAEPFAPYCPHGYSSCVCVAPPGAHGSSEEGT